MKKFIVAASLLFAVPTAACAESFPVDSTLLIKGPIADQTMGPILTQMNGLVVADPAPSRVTLILDSPGGSVHTGFKFISQMKTLQGKGTKFHCYVTGMAASMAFHILTQCDKRVVLQESMLLWHRARIFVMFGIVTAPSAREVAKDLEPLDSLILQSVLSTVGKDMSRSEVIEHFERETFHVGVNLCAATPRFCVAKSHVPGLIEAVNNPAIISTVNPRKLEPENKKKNMFTGIESVVYICEQFLLDLMEDK